MPKKEEGPAGNRANSRDLLSVPSILPEQSPPVKVALERAARGWRVLPVNPKTRVPLIKEWQKKASTDEDIIRGWWQEFPNAATGIATGIESNLVVIDVDNGPVGEVKLSGLEAHHGTLPKTLGARTPGNPAKDKLPGRHLYFEHSGGYVKNSTSQLAENIDVRGDAGFAIAYPLSDDDQEPAELPRAWRALLQSEIPT